MLGGKGVEPTTVLSWNLRPIIDRSQLENREIK